jgi:hypothetical protein
MKTGNVDNYGIAVEAELIDNSFGNDLIQPRDIDTRHQGCVPNIAIQMIWPHSGASQPLGWLVSEEIREHMQGAAMKSQLVDNYGNQCLTVRNLMLVIFEPLVNKAFKNSRISLLAKTSCYVSMRNGQGLYRADLADKYQRKAIFNLIRSQSFLSDRILSK